MTEPAPIRDSQSKARDLRSTARAGAGSEFPSLPRDYRGAFPFRLATTSYIYPDHIVPNAVLLAPYVDEMELILFEGRNLPDPREMADLSRLRAAQGLLYNVHLPLDVFLGHPSDEVRAEGINTVLKAVDLTGALSPSTYTLHYVRDEAEDGRNVSLWKKRIVESTRSLLEGGLAPRLISVETLHYPFVWVEDMVRDFGLSICLDLGHILMNGEDPCRYLATYLERTSVVHVYGVDQGRAHQGLEVLDEGMLREWLRYLKGYRGTVSLEVFSLDHLSSSLGILEKLWGTI